LYFARNSSHLVVMKSTISVFLF